MAKSSNQLDSQIRDLELASELKGSTLEKICIEISSKSEHLALLEQKKKQLIFNQEVIACSECNNYSINLQSISETITSIISNLKNLYKQKEKIEEDLISMEYQVYDSIKQHYSTNSTSSLDYDEY